MADDLTDACHEHRCRFEERRRAILVRQTCTWSRAVRVGQHGIARAAVLLALGVFEPARAAEANDTQLKLASPLDYEVFQRGDDGRASLVVAGEWGVSRRAVAVPDALEMRVISPGREGERDSGWTPLPFDARAHGFRAELPLPAGGWYRVQARLLRTGTPLASVEVAHVGAGEVFIIAGQSNSANYGEERQHPASDLVSAFDGERWAIAHDPQPGATGTKGSFVPSFGDALARALHVPVGVVCIGVGSTSVREWLPAGHPMSTPPTTGAHCVVLAGGKLVSSGELFARLQQALQRLPHGGARAVLWHQGESDWNQPPGHAIPLAEFRTDLAELIRASRTVAGWDVPWFVAQASYHGPADPGSAEFRAQQLAVTDGRLTLRGPDTDTLTGAWRENDGRGVHFSAAGQRRHGEMWAEIVSAWIGQQMHVAK